MEKSNQKNNKSSAPSSFISMECKLFRKNEKETLKKNRDRANDLSEHIVNWIDTFPELSKRNPNLFLSLVGLRFCEMLPDMQLTLFSILSGGYFNAVRNLRFTFESMIHAVYLEDEYPEVFPGLFFEVINEQNEEIDFENHLEQKIVKKYPQKLNLIREVTGFKVRIIDKLAFLEGKEKEKLKITYHKLSQLSHPSPNQIKKLLHEPGFAFTHFYDEKLFNECADLTDEVMDVTFAIALYKFPALIPTIKTQENSILFNSLCRLPITKRFLVV